MALSHNLGLKKLCTSLSPQGHHVYPGVPKHLFSKAILAFLHTTLKQTMLQNIHALTPAIIKGICPTSNLLLRASVADI